MGEDGLDTKRVVVVLPCGIIGEATLLSWQDPWDDDDDEDGDGEEGWKKKRMNNMELTNHMIRRILDDLKSNSTSKKLLRRQDAILFAGHSMGCVLSQQLLKMYGNREDAFLNSFPNCFFAGSAPYVWTADQNVTENNGFSRISRWFRKEDDVCTKTLGSGYVVKGAENVFTVAQMIKQLENGEYDKKYHDWGEYLNDMETWIKSS